MPTSDDELDGYHHQPEHPGMSKAEQRRSNKPVMEKRRRARINHCLNELKALILDAMNKDPARHSKLEKADILEMTVKHLQTIQQQQLSLAVSADPAVVHKFKTGFHECAGEVGRYIGRMDGVEAGVKQRLVNHLASCVQQMTPFTLPAPTAPAAIQGSPDDVNNNSASARLQMMTGLQLIPSRLPSGELALLLPNSQNLPFFPPPLDNHVSTTTESPVVAHSIDRSRNSAFTAVYKDKQLDRSPLPSPTSTTVSSYDDDSCDGAFLSPEVTSTSEHLRTTHDSGVPFQTDQNQKTYSHQLLKLYPNNFSDSKKDSRQNTSIPRFPNPVKTIQPLTVITSNDILKDHPQRFLETKQTNFKDPLDFSVKKDSIPISYSLPLKRPFQDDSSDKLLMKAPEFHAPQKIPRLYVDSHLQNKLERRSLHEIQIQKHPTQSQSQLNPQPERQSLLEIQNQPSTSSSEVPRDMWRPW